MNKKQENIKSSFERIQMRRRARDKYVPPNAHCLKCGADAWEPDFEAGAQSWYCFLCGNRGFWEKGTFKQTFKGE